MTRADGNQLRDLLRELGLHATVESRGMLAVVVPTEGAPSLTPQLRRRLVALARDCGFSHVALEVVPGTHASE